MKEMKIKTALFEKRVELDFLPRSSVKECVTEIRTLLNEARNVDNTQKNVYWLSDKAVAYLQVELELYAGNYPAVLELTKDLETEYPESVLGADVYKYLWSSENSDARILASISWNRFIWTSVLIPLKKVIIWCCRRMLTMKKRISGKNGLRFRL